MKRPRRAAMRGHTVKELGQLAGVSVRTLHHYDAIGLLKPAYVGANGYRYYGRDELLRLQEILVLRELDISLSDIATVLAAGRSDRASRLVAHRDRLVADAERRNRLIATLDRTIQHLKEDTPMMTEDLYDGISPERQESYEAWLIDRYGSDMAERIKDARGEIAPTSTGMLNSGTDAMAELARIESALVAVFQDGADPSADAVGSLIADHRDWVAARWKRPCDADAYAGLADLYQSHPDFVARYETLASGFSAFLNDAMNAHACAIRKAD
ncbi:MerR family transcriptional regulator [Jannaschia sp. CCS1]|uniref:MerR family transcriptional regulator n=1 Tax=Jannaschia sp. (strain CCS1) TaxID=290400 RepID=UPI000053A0CE|nr:MerR family transcriptional regulator [Jannaschia sp. CCS1]ABD56592.1 transcriptional regulator, MerR family [Jannaschia sp. CCS1]